MNKILKKGIYETEKVTRPSSFSVAYMLLHGFVCVFVVLSLFSAVMLLVTDVIPTSFPHAPFSSAPLILIGATYLGFQGLTRPKFVDLLKALIVCTAFILWGIDQMLPTGWPAMTLGDIVITLYVLDLSWNIIDRLKEKHT